MNNENLKSNLLSASHWMRFVFMILFSVILFVTNILMKILVTIQFLFALITGSDNPNLRQFGDSLSQFIYAVLRFLTYNTEDKPYPFSAWPEPAPLAEIDADDAEDAAATEPVEESLGVESAADDTENKDQ